MSVKLYLYDDGRARTWEPFALTRPIGELLFGCMLLRERVERTWNTPCVAHLAGPGLVGFDEPGAPPALALAPPATEDRILINSRAVLAGAPRPSLDAAAVLTLEGQVAGLVLPASHDTPAAAQLEGEGGEALAGLPRIPVAGFFLQDPWDLVTRNPERIAADLDLLGFGSLKGTKGVRVLGNGGLFGRGGAEVEAGVILDTRDGPVILDGGARIQGPARISGPCYLGRGSVLLGGVVEKSSIGTGCKIRGEVADSVITGSCNKAHDGFLGHALLGRWVNLGALTTNSDLKNTYGPVRVERSTGTVDTEQLKVGCFLGDHVRTGIGTLLNTGAVVGAGSTLFGGGVSPKFVPPFSWGAGEAAAAVRFDRFLETSRRAMARRDQVLPQSMAELWKRAYEATRDQRESRGVLD